MKSWFGSRWRVGARDDLNGLLVIFQISVTINFFSRILLCRGVPQSTSSFSDAEIGVEYEFFKTGMIIIVVVINDRNLMIYPGSFPAGK